MVKNNIGTNKNMLISKIIQLRCWEELDGTQVLPARHLGHMAWEIIKMVPLIVTRNADKICVRNLVICHTQILKRVRSPVINLQLALYFSNNCCVFCRIISPQASGRRIHKFQNNVSGSRCLHLPHICTGEFPCSCN